MVLPKECLRLLLFLGDFDERRQFFSCQNPAWNVRSVNSRLPDPYLTVQAQRRQQQQQNNVRSHLQHDPRRSQVLNSLTSDYPENSIWWSSGEQRSNLAAERP